MTAKVVQALPEGDEWSYEVKFDGYRLRAESAVIDGEIVAVDSEGRPSFQALQRRGAHSGFTIVFYAFDLIHIDVRVAERRDNTRFASRSAGGDGRHKNLRAAPWSHRAVQGRAACRA